NLTVLGTHAHVTTADTSRRSRRRERPRVVPAARWQRAAGWLIDVTPFVLLAVGATFWIAGPSLVIGVLEDTVGMSSGTALPSPSAVLRAGTPEHHLLGELLTLAAILCLIAVAWVAYRVIATARFGRTVGKWVVGSAVVRVDDPTRPPTVKQSWVRFVVPQASGWIPLPGTGLLPYLALVVHPRRRGVHDKAAGTIVVKSDRAHTPRAGESGQRAGPNS
ncbi:MAG: hypothetical protein JWM93_1839, partial [Frankiales bacterium]|nr:hypothetical protein [Frankiales bacterium]